MVNLNSGYKAWRKKWHYHLSCYKEKVLMIEEKGLYKENPTPFVLPKEKKWANIIESYYHKDIIKILEEKSILSLPDKFLHQEFHHLTSSQALGFNLFLPVFISCGWKIDKNYILEHKPEETEGTCFDIFVKSEKNLGVEIKFLEGIFDEKNEQEKEEKRMEYKEHKYKKRFDNMYNKYFDEITQDEFYDYYQIYRHLIYSCQDNWEVLYYVLEERKYIWEELIKEKQKQLKNEYRQNCKIEVITIDSFVKRYRTNGPDALKDHLKKFKDKYLVNK